MEQQMEGGLSEAPTNTIVTYQPGCDDIADVH